MKIVLCEKKCAYDWMLSDRKSMESDLSVERAGQILVNVFSLSLYLYF